MNIQLPDIPAPVAALVARAEVDLSLIHICAGVAFADVSTGEFRYFSLNDMRLSLADELARIEPREIIVNDRAALAACVPERAERAGDVYKRQP